MAVNRVLRKENWEERKEGGGERIGRGERGRGRRWGRKWEGGGVYCCCLLIFKYLFC